MKTYHMYNADSISAQSKLKEAEKQEDRQAHVPLTLQPRSALRRNMFEGAQ
jgi:hypothetical protein